MYALNLRDTFGADLPYAEDEHLSAVRGLLINWLQNTPDRRGKKYLAMQVVLEEVERRLREEFRYDDMRDIDRAPQDLFLRYLNDVSRSWRVLAQFREMP